MKNMDNYIYDGWEEVRINSEDKKHIHVHENFISEEDLVKINEFCLTAEHIESNPLILIDYIPTVVKNYETEITKILRSYRDKICKLLEETYDCKININSGYSEISSISRYTPGTLLNPHADKETSILVIRKFQVFLVTRQEHYSTLMRTRCANPGAT